MTGLPPSDGNTVVLSIKDSFSKAVHFVPLLKLPSALEMANLLVLQGFRSPPGRCVGPGAAVHLNISIEKNYSNDFSLDSGTCKYAYEHPNNLGK